MERMARHALLWAAVATIGVVGRVGAQGQFEELARVFDYSAAAPLDVHQEDSTNVGPVVVRDINYASPKGGRVPAYLVVPVGKSGPCAGIVFVHWGQGNRSEFVSEAIALAHRGAVSLLIDAPFNRLDDPNRDKPDSLGEHDAYIQLVIDIRRGVDLLRSRPEVDTSRIGYVGHSLGATWGGLVAGVDHRVKAFVLMGGLPTLTDYDFPDPMIRQQALSRAPADRQANERVMTPINPVRFVGHSSPAALFFQWATFDRYIARRAAKEYFDAAGTPKSQQWYVSSHEFNDPRARVDRDEFLATHLRLTANR